jgi:hypothetical protein
VYRQLLDEPVTAVIAVMGRDGRPWLNHKNPYHWLTIKATPSGRSTRTTPTRGTGRPRRSTRQGRRRRHLAPGDPELVFGLYGPGD